MMPSPRSRRSPAFLRVALLMFFVSLMGAGVSACSMMETGNVGWFCETDGDCKPDLTCETYVHQGSDHENKLCTGDKRLEDNSSNYGWIFLVSTWLFLVVIPGGVAVLVVVGMIRTRLQSPAAAPPA